MTNSNREMHERVRQRRNQAFAEFMDIVYDSMSSTARRSLPCRYPDDIERYVNAIVWHARDRLNEFETGLKTVVAGTFEESPKGERFIRDPSPNRSHSEQCLFLDSDGELVTVRSPRLEWNAAGDLVMNTYQFYEVLTGPNAGATFVAADRPLPAIPRRTVRRPETSISPVETAEPARDFFLPRASSGSDLAVQDPSAAHLFLSHAWTDKALARRIERRLSSRALKVWVDDDQMHPGDVLPAAIEAAIRASTHFLPW